MTQNKNDAGNALASKSFCKACGATLDVTNIIGQKNGFDFIPCSQCKSVTVHPFPSMESLAAHYQSYPPSEMYISKKDKKIARSRKRISRLIKLAPGKRFLDVGCNYGLTVKAALDLGLDAKGIDIDANTVKMGKETIGIEGALNVISVEDYAAKGNKVDIVYTSEVIEHVHSPDAFIHAIASLLNTGGILYLTTPQANHWMIPKDFAQYDVAKPPIHITYFSKAGITALLKRHGFKITRFTFGLKPGIRLTAIKT